MNEQLKINVIAHLILDHLSGIRDYFESAIGTTNDQEMEVNMFHSIDDLAGEIYTIIETFNDTENWQEYRKKLRVALSIDRYFHPLVYSGTNDKERIETGRQNQQIHTEVIKKLESEPSKRWSQIRSLKRELDLFKIFHLS